MRRHAPRLAAFLALLPLVAAAAAGAAKPALAPVPAGCTLPALLEHSLDAKHVRAGDVVTARLAQRVPLGAGAYLPPETEVVGSVTAVSPTSLSLLFSAVRLRGVAEPVRLKLVAAAGWLEVINTRDALGGPTHSTSDWTTEQVGGDEIYGANVATKVYDRYSQPVARADGTGVYAPPLASGKPERALGPFSTTAEGLYGLDDIAITSTGGQGAIVFSLTNPHWKLHAGAGLLFEVIAP